MHAQEEEEEERGAINQSAIDGCDVPDEGDAKPNAAEGARPRSDGAGRASYRSDQNDAKRPTSNRSTLRGTSRGGSRASSRGATGSQVAFLG